MKYKESRSQKFAGGAGFYITIAACLAVIGITAWVVLANRNPAVSEKPKTNGTDNSSYNDNPSSYNSNENPLISSSVPTAPVGENVSGQPYSESDKEAETPTAKSFTMPVQGEVLKGYDDSVLQYSATYGDLRLHTGVDIACESGTSVSTAGDGKVVSITEDSAYGKTVTIDHGNGLIAKYCGLDDIKVKEAEKVKMGDIIGTVSVVPCECADQNHIHVEVLKNDKSVSPLKTFGLE